MTLEELEATLPNGLHDAEIRSISLDYVKQTARLSLDVWVGGMDLPEGPERERYRRASLEFTGLLYCAIEPPDFRPEYSGFAQAGPVSTSESVPVESPASLPAGTFEARVFVRDWNSFIQFAASGASLTWLD